MTARIFIHAGLSKTGSTTLQHDLFPTIPGLVHLGTKGRVLATGDLREAGLSIVRALTFGARDIAAGATLLPPLIEARDRIMAVDGPVVLSEESWTGRAVERPYAPGEYVPAALRRLFGDAWSAILVLREPIAHAASWLLQTMVRSPLYRRWPDGTRRLLGPAAALNWHVTRAESDPRSIFRTGCRFDAVVDSYAAVVGRDRLHLLAFERLFEDEDACRLAFARIFGVSADGPPLGRWNERSEAQRRSIAMQHLPDPADADQVEAFVTAWADTRAIVAADPAVRAFIERHSLDLWRAVAGRSDGFSAPGGALPVSSSRGSVVMGNTPEDTA